MLFRRYGLWSGAAVVTAVLLSANEARAQAGAATLTGRVVDASTKNPAADVVVTISSPQVQGEETVVTDSTGFFRAANLPPGQYVLRFDKETFKPYSRTGIDLRADITLRVDAELLPEGLKEEIVVVAQAPTVDVGSSNTGLNIGQDFARRVPLVRPNSAAGGAVRSFEAVAQATPQAAADAFGTSVNGTTSNENNFMVDGLSRNNAGFGTNGARLSMEFVREVNVLTGGYMPEYGLAGGGILSAVTEHGGNEFHGGAWFNISPGFLEGERSRIYRNGQTITTQPSLDSIGDIGVKVGGPLIKDKLWFYAGYMMARTAYNLDRSFNSAAAGELQDTKRRYASDREDIQAFAKLNYSLNSHNRFELTGYVLPSRSGGSDRIAIDPQLGVPAVANITGTTNSLANYIVANTTSVQGDWETDSTNKKVLLKTTVGWMHQVEDTRANDGTYSGDGYGQAAIPGVSWRRNTPGYHGIADFEPVSPWECDAAGTTSAKQCPVTSYSSGGPGFLSSRTFDRWQGRSVLTLLGEAAGHHVVKFGVELDAMQYASTRSYSGGNLLRESASGKSFADYRNYSYETAPDQRILLDDLHWTTHSLIMGGFAQDSWSILDKFTINAGVRYDAQLMWGGDGSLTMTMPNMISPRAGFVWDPFQKGMAKIYGNFAQYYQPLPLNIMDRAGSSEPQASAARSATKCDPRDATQLKGSCQDPANFLDQGGASSPDKKYVLTGAGKTPIDPDLKPQYSNELVLGAEQDVVKNGRVGLSWTHRWLGRIIEDVSRDEAQTYFITNPGQGPTSDFPKPVRDYDAGTIFFQKTFGNNWEALASYTLAYLRGNWAGLFRPETLQIDPGTNSDFDLKSLVINRTGPLPGDTRHQLKVFGSKTIDFGEHSAVSLGAGAHGTSGAPTSYLGSHPLYGPDEVFILPRGEGNRLPWTYSFDTNFAYIAKLTPEQTLTFTLECFNLLNFQEITQRDDRYTSSDVIPIANGHRGDLGQLQTTANVPLQKHEVNPNFGNATSYQQPRQFRLGVRGTF